MAEPSLWPYVKQVPRSGHTDEDMAAFLTANGKAATAAHGLAVAQTGVDLAARFGMDPAPVQTAGWLHDIAAVLRPADMTAYALSRGWRLDEAEKRHPFLLHQRLSAVLARWLFDVHDPAILSAIACHTTLKADATGTDMVLLVADKLAWDQPGAPPYEEAVRHGLARSLPHAALAYVDFAMDHGLILTPHRWLLDARVWLRAQTGAVL